MTSSTSAPFSTWSDADHSGPILIGTTLCMLYWFVAGTMQQFLLFARGTRYSWADYFLTGAMAAAFVQSTLILVACHDGLGRSEHTINVEEGRRLYRISNVFYALSLGLIKCSAALFVANLTVKNMGSLRRVPAPQKAALLVILALTVCWTIGSVVALGLPCSAKSPGTCMGTVSRWVGVFVGDATTDTLISAYAASVILRTKAPIGKRIAWFLPFLVRICVPLIAGLRLLSVSTHKLTHDPTISLWLFVTLTQVQVMISIISAAIPALKQTLLDLSTHYGATNDSQSGSRRHGNSYLLERMSAKSGKKQRSLSHQKGSQDPPFPGPPVAGLTRSRNRAHVKSGGDMDGESQDGIIRQDESAVTWDNGEASDREHHSEDGYSRT